MPPLKRWIQFLTSAGGIIGAGVLFVKYGTPSDEEFLRTLSQELQQRYKEEKIYRETMDKLMQERIGETYDKPAWLQGSAAMKKLDKELSEEARRIISEQAQDKVLSEEKLRIAELKKQEDFK